MKRIIGVGLVVLLAFAAIGTLQPRDASAEEARCSLNAYNAINCYFKEQITEARLRQILNGLTPSVSPFTITTNSVTISPPRDDTWVDPNPPPDLTPWAMIEQYAASRNPGNYCTPTFTVTTPSNIRPQRYANQVYTVRNINYNRPYCVAYQHWLNTKDLYVNEDGTRYTPPEPQPEDY